MNIREAILAAADWIQNNPDDFNFKSVEVPSCGTPGCAIGWIDAFSGVRPGTVIACKDSPIKSTWKFYMDMDSASGDTNWQRSAQSTAKALRCYADKLYPAEPFKELPSGAEVCRAIVLKPFRERVEA